MERASKANEQEKGLERADLRPQGEGGGWMDGQMDENLEIHPWPSGHRPFGATAQNVSQMLFFPLFDLITTDG